MVAQRKDLLVLTSVKYASGSYHSLHLLMLTGEIQNYVGLPGINQIKK